MDNTSQLRPLSIGDLLDTAFRLYRAHFLTFVGIVAAAQIPLLILQTLLDMLLGQRAVAQLSRFVRGATSAPLDSVLRYYTFLFGVYLLQVLLAQSLSTAAVARVVAGRAHGDTSSIRGAYQMPRIMVARLVGAAGVRGLMGAVLAAPLLVGYILLLLASANRDIVRLALVMLFCVIALLIIVPVAVLVLLRFMFTTQAIVLEGLGVTSALRRSWRLFGAGFWRTIGSVLLMLLLWGALYLVPSAICYVVLRIIFPDSVGSYTTRQPIQMLVSYTAQILATPFAYIGYTLIYFDLRARAEGYDIEVMARQAALI